jgi:catechol 1,2-dioxygenase
LIWRRCAWWDTVNFVQFVESQFRKVAMSRLPRRDFLRRTTVGLAAWGAGGLVLSAAARPTEASGDLGEYARFLAESDPPAPPTGDWQPTADNILGPYYRPGAPYRGKITPPLEPGPVLLISGRAWGYDTKRPLAGAVLDIWQANAAGRYDNDDPQKPPAPGVFRNRARIVADENGYYEYETVHPGPYRTGPDMWRPSHIHYMVRHAGYATLVTQLYFKGDPHNATDEFIRPSLIIALDERSTPHGKFQAGTFDIVLAKADGRSKPA